VEKTIIAAGARVLDKAIKQLGYLPQKQSPTDAQHCLLPPRHHLLAPVPRILAPAPQIREECEETFTDIGPPDISFFSGLRIRIFAFFYFYLSRISLRSSWAQIALKYTYP
jgi:hypothetical protein